jgi:hypothetical protein
VAVRDIQLINVHLVHFADSSRTSPEVPEVPIADSCIATNEEHGCNYLLDHLVGKELKL